MKLGEWSIELADEPNDLSAEDYLGWIKRIRRLWPEAQFWANPAFAPKNNAYSTPNGIIETLSPYISTWMPYIETLVYNAEFPNQPGTLDAFQATGKPVWYYWITQIYDRPPSGGRRTPLTAWWFSLNGWGFYAMTCVQDNVNPWTDNIYAHIYPHNTVSLWMEGLRQGVQDYKRLWLLDRQGVPRSRLAPLVDAILRQGMYMPWSQTSPPSWQTMRQALDQLLLDKQQPAAPAGD